MNSVVFESVTKVFRHRPALFNWVGTERKGETRAVENFSLGIREGSVLVLLGPNGSGKTTTLKLVSTMLLPDSGKVMVRGLDTASQAQVVRRHIGFAVANERSFFPRLTARENLDFFATFDDVPRRERRDCIDSMLERTGLAEAASTLVMKFSSGMYQKLAIARALIKRPSVVLLDEPTRSLDPASALQFWELVRSLPERGATVLLATHSFNEAVAVGDFVAILQEGRLVAHRNLAGVGVDELRDFYFDGASSADDVLCMAGGCH